MTVQEYRDYIAGNPVVAGSEAHLFMHKIDVVPRTVVGGVPAKFIKNIEKTNR